MDLSKVLSIAGKPGLYKVIGQMKNGVLVESLEDGKRFPAYAHHQLSLLSEISIYGTDRDIPLEEIMTRIAENKQFGSVEVPKNNEEIMDVFSIIIEEVDEERVYPSDAKKVLKWYNSLLNKGFILQEEKEEKSTKKAVKGAKAKGGTQATTEQKPKAKNQKVAKKVTSKGTNSIKTVAKKANKGN